MTKKRNSVTANEGIGKFFIFLGIQRFDMGSISTNKAAGSMSKVRVIIDVNQGIYCHSTGSLAQKKTVTCQVTVSTMNSIVISLLLQ